MLADRRGFAINKQIHVEPALPPKLATCIQTIYIVVLLVAIDTRNGDHKRDNNDEEQGDTESSEHLGLLGSSGCQPHEGCV